MRCALLSLLLTSLPVATATADDFGFHDRHRAQLELQRYVQVEYPAEVRRLRSEMQFAEVEINAMRQQLAEYRPFSKFETGSALNAEIRWLKLKLYAAELRLYNLREHYYTTQRVHRERLHQLAIGARMSL